MVARPQLPRVTVDVVAELVAVHLGFVVGDVDPDFLRARPRARRGLAWLGSGLGWDRLRSATGALGVTVHRALEDDGRRNYSKKLFEKAVSVPLRTASLLAA